MHLDFTSIVIFYFYKEGKKYDFSDSEFNT